VGVTLVLAGPAHRPAQPEREHRGEDQRGLGAVKPGFLTRICFKRASGSMGSEL
jgi:hypothetical protein